MPLPRRSPLLPTLYQALLTSASLVNPTITGTIAGGATYASVTLTTPTIASILNGGTLTLPSGTDTLVGRATTDTLSNKTLSSPTLTGTVGGTAQIRSGYLVVDSGAANTGAALNSGGTNPNGSQGLLFGNTGTGGEGISSQRQTGGDNLYGLDFWTNFVRRFHVTNAGLLVFDNTVELNNQLLHLHNVGDNNHVLWYNSGIDGPELRGYSAARLIAQNGTIYTQVQTGAVGNSSLGGTNVVSGTFQGGTIGGNRFQHQWDGNFRHYVDASNVKNFVIEHPLRKDRYLRYVVLEGPHNDVFCRGEGRLIGGEVTVTLPDHFVAITDESTAMVEVFEIAEDECPHGCHREEGDWKAWERQRLARDGGGSSGPLPHHRHAVPTHLPPNLSPTRVKDGRFTVRMTDGHVHDCTAFWWRVTAQRSDIPLPDFEPKKKDYVLAGDGPYTYLTRRTA